MWALKLCGLLAALPLIASAADPIKSNNSGWSTNPSINTSPVHVTLLQLLTNPVPYDQRYIQLMGVLSVDFEDNRLYFSKEFFDAFYPEYAVEIKLPSGALAASTRFQGKYVVLAGTFTLQAGAFSHGLLDVTSMKIAEQPRKAKSK